MGGGGGLVEREHTEGGGIRVLIASGGVGMGGTDAAREMRVEGLEGWRAGRGVWKALSFLLSLVLSVREEGGCEW